MSTFHVGFSGPGGSTGVKKVEAGSALEAVKSAPNALTLEGSIATIIGSNPMVDHWLFVYTGGVWVERQ
jgi:hypothetical protein